jgi:hypothetical protein
MKRKIDNSFLSNSIIFEKDKDGNLDKTRKGGGAT